MELDRYIRCNCGKNMKVSWIGKAEFRKGKVTFCIGITKCRKCKIRKEHYSGDLDDIQAFIDFRAQNY
jgi:hypothetical protein